MRSRKDYRLTAHLSRLTVVGECIGPGGLAGLQNRDGGASGVFGGFDSHTLPPLQGSQAQRGRKGHIRLFFAWVLCVLCVFASTAAAQTDTTPVYRPAPVGPMGAFFRSLTIPGWGQARLDRRLTGGIFLAFEGIALGMAIKADRELAYLKSRDEPQEAIDDKRQEREDWITLVAFNHLFAALDAFVGSHLYDFPEDVKLRAAPSGFGAIVSIPVRLP